MLGRNTQRKLVGVGAFVTGGQSVPTMFRLSSESSASCVSYRSPLDFGDKAYDSRFSLPCLPVEGRQKMNSIYSWLSYLLAEAVLKPSIYIFSDQTCSNQRRVGTAHRGLGCF